MQLFKSLGRTIGLSVMLVASSSLSNAYAAKAGGGTSGGGKTPYTYYVSGDPAAPVNLVPPTTRSTVLMGGGEDIHEAFKWMIRRAGVTPGTGGRFVVIRATGADGYNCYLWQGDYPLCQNENAPVVYGSIGGKQMGLSSVETLVIPNAEAANHTFVLERIKAASAIFIAGGDQSDYIKSWKGTNLHALLDEMIHKNKTPIGGTSAGLAVLGQFDFAALRGSVTSEQALADPFNRYMTLDPSPLDGPAFLQVGGVANTITDAHVDERARLGRLVTFVSRLVRPVGGAGCAGGILGLANTGDPNFARGIGLGIETAMVVEESGGQMYGTRLTNPDNNVTKSQVYFVRLAEAPTVCAAGSPLSVNNVEISVVGNHSSAINLSDWSNLTFTRYSVKSGLIQGFQY